MGWNLRGGKEQVMAEINITPLTDVMLVLLVVFMVTTPLFMMESIKLKLPKAVSAGSEQGKGVVVTVTEDGRFFVNSNRVDRGELKSALKSEFSGRAEKTVLLKADTETMHGAVVFALDTAREAGALKLSIGTEPEASPK